ncbi:MAG: PAS domain-containing protein [Candidatus Omnitrophica bacterium]|jgi:PAS domain S-box-containing protein|nr:PAS domain-containing protein [Candidatus Omnitrophota bacterium]
MQEVGKIKVLLVGGGGLGTELISLLSQSGTLELVGVVDRDMNAPGAVIAKKRGIPVYSDHRNAISAGRFDKIICALPSEELREEILRSKPENVELVDGSKMSFLRNFLVEMSVVQEKLVASEELYRGLFNHAADLIIVVDNYGRFLDANDEFIRECGYTREEMLGKSVLTSGIVTAESSAKIAFHLAKVSSGMDIPTFEVEGVRKSGEIIDYELRAVPIRKEGRITGIQAILRNITERKKTEETLVRIKLQQEAILNNIPDMAWLKDKEGRFVAVNESFGKACGRTPEDLSGKTDMDVWPLELAEKYAADDKDVVRTRKRKRVEEPFEDLHAGRRTIETIKTPVLNEKGEIVGTTGIARDVTERKVLEEQLVRSEVLYRTIFENTGTAMVLAREDMTIIRVNNEFEKLSGYKAEECENGMKVADFIHEQDLDKINEMTWLKKVSPETSPKGFELRFVDKKGSARETVITIASIPGPGDLVVSIQDISELKRNEYQLTKQKELLDNANKVLEHKLHELEEAIGHIKKLEGLVPICANCKKMRLGGKDPKDPASWVALEKFLTERTEASFTHGLCPDCIKRLYGAHLGLKKDK